MYDRFKPPLGHVAYFLYTPSVLTMLRRHLRIGAAGQPERKVNRKGSQLLVERSLVSAVRLYKSVPQGRQVGRSGGIADQIGSDRTQALPQPSQETGSKSSRRPSFCWITRVQYNEPSTASALRPPFLLPPCGTYLLLIGCLCGSTRRKQFSRMQQQRQQAKGGIIPMLDANLPSSGLVCVNGIATANREGVHVNK